MIETEQLGVPPGTSGLGRNSKHKKVKVTDAPLRSLRIQEQGNRVAVGDENGSVTLLKLSEALSHVSTNCYSSMILH